MTEADEAAALEVEDEEDSEVIEEVEVVDEVDSVEIEAEEVVDEVDSVVVVTEEALGVVVEVSYKSPLKPTTSSQPQHPCQPSSSTPSDLHTYHTL